MAIEEQQNLVNDSIYSNIEHNTSVVEDIGHNMNNGNQIPLPSNKNLLLIKNDKVNKINPNVYSKHYISSKSNVSHFFSFLLILSLTIIITLLIIFH